MGAEDTLGAAASAALPQTGTSSGNQSQILQQLIMQHIANKPGTGIPLLTTGTQLNQPSLPPTYQQPGLTSPNRPGGYQSSGERKRDEKASMFQNIGATVKSFTDYDVAKKQRHMEMLTEKLMSAFAGLNEAKSTGNQDAIKKNADIVNDILGDPKNRKLFEKAFDINFFGDSKGKDSPEQKGLLASLKKMDDAHKSGQEPLNAYAQRFQQAAGAQRLQESPQAQAQKQAIKDNLTLGAKETAENAAKDFKTLSEVYKTDKTIETKEKMFKTIADLKDKQIQATYLAHVASVNGSYEAARIKVGAENYRTKTMAQTAISVADKRIASAEKLMGMNNDEKTKLEGMKDTNKLDVAKLGILKQSDTELKQYNTEIGQYRTQIEDLRKDIEAKNKDIASYDKESWTKYITDPSRRSKLIGDINGNKAKMSTIQGMMNGAMEKRAQRFSALNALRQQSGLAILNLNIDASGAGSSEASPQDVPMTDLPQVGTDDMTSIANSIGSETAAPEQP